MDSSPVPSLEEGLLNAFSKDPTIIGKPKRLRTDHIFVNPEGFSAFRIRPDPTKLVSFTFYPAVDLRSWIVTSDRKKAIWSAQKKLSNCYFHGNTGERYLVIAPGPSLMAKIVGDFNKDTGVEKDQLMQEPDIDIQEWLQVNDRRGNGTFALAGLMILWEE